jgi:hypothetical protein
VQTVTISMPDDLHREMQSRAAKAGLTVSRYIAEVLIETNLPPADGDDRRREHRAALERFLAGPKLGISEGGRMPNAEERNAR